MQLPDVAIAFASPHELWMGILLASFCLLAVLVWCPAPALLLPVRAAWRVATRPARVSPPRAVPPFTV